MSQTGLDICLKSEQEVLDSHAKRQLMHQIVELQAAVNDMKSAFTNALQQLGSIQCDDQTHNKNECQDQIAEVIKLLLSMRAEFGGLKNVIVQIQQTQHTSQLQINSVLAKQNLLITELCRTGIVSENMRQQLVCSHFPVERTPSGCQSSDSGVALLLEKAHTAFQCFSPSDQDVSSISENSPVVISYTADYVSDVQQNGYESDSSLVTAANKSLSLSTSLGKQCGLELDHLDSSSEDDGEYLMEDVEPSSPSKGNVYASSKITYIGTRHSQDAKINNPRHGNKNTAENKSRVKEKHFRECQKLQLMADLVESEKKYCKSLWTLQDMFAEPLKQKKILNVRDINTIFPEEICQLYEKHCMLLHKLEERNQMWKWHGGVGDIFVRFTNPDETNILRWYTSYINDFPEVLKTFHKLCRQSGGFTKFLKTCLQHPNCKNLDLGNFLLAPVQRIPNYVLLLKQLQKYTEVDHPDSKFITIVLNRMSDCLSRLNDSMEHSFQLITSQMNPQTEMNDLVKSTTKTRKQMRSFPTQRDVLSDIENDSQHDMKMDADLCRTISKETLCSNEENLLLRQQLPASLKNWGSQESLKGLCKRKLQRHPHTENNEFSAVNKFYSDLNLSLDCTRCKHRLTRSQKFSNYLSEDAFGDLCCGHADLIPAGRETEENLAGQPERLSFNVNNTRMALQQHLSEPKSEQVLTPVLQQKVDITVSDLPYEVEDNEICSKFQLPKPKEKVGSLPNELLLSEESQNTSFAETKNLLVCSAKRNIPFTYNAAHEDLRSCNLTSPRQLCGPVRPLSKSRSAHAVHEVATEQNQGTDNGNVWTDETCHSRKTKEKLLNKNEKKKISLRALKSLWFFKKRHNVAGLKGVGTGAYASHDVLFPTNDDKLVLGRHSE